MTRTLPYRGISIEFPGKDVGVFNPVSEPFALDIAKLAANHGFDFVDLHQPWGGQYIGGTRGYNPELANAMPPFFKGLSISPHAIKAADYLTERGVHVAVYGGAGWLFGSGTDAERDVVYMTQDRLDDVREAAFDLGKRIRMDSYWIDDMGKVLSFVGMQKGRTWKNPMEDSATPEYFRLRKDYPGPVRWQAAVQDIFRAWRTGLEWVNPEIVVGVEPDPRDSNGLVDEWLPPSTPLMFVCDPPQVASCRANSPGRMAFLILNDWKAGYTLDQIASWRRKAEEKGYSTIVTWWVWKVALQKAGHKVPGG